jgi:hypothetical protein
MLFPFGITLAFAAVRITSSNIERILALRHRDLVHCLLQPILAAKKVG